MLFLKTSRYFHATRTLHPYLEHNLKANKLLPLRNLQLKVNTIFFRHSRHHKIITTFF